jgi:hypothetical protein
VHERASGKFAPQSHPLVIRELEHGVVREAILVAPDSARQRPGLDAGELGEVGVEHYLALADDHESLVNCPSGLSQVTRGSSLGRQAFVRAKAPPALHTD